MNQLELLERQREAIRVYVQAETKRAAEESATASARQTGMRVVEERAKAVVSEAKQLVDKATFLLETASPRIAKVGLKVSVMSEKAKQVRVEGRGEPLDDLRAVVHIGALNLKSLDSALIHLHDWHVAEQDRRKEEEEEERRRVEKLGVEVVVCPSCSTRNSLVYTNCVKCSAKLSKGKVISNPYLYPDGRGRK